MIRYFYKSANGDAVMNDGDEKIVTVHVGSNDNIIIKASDSPLLEELTGEGWEESGVDWWNADVVPTVTDFYLVGGRRPIPPPPH